MNSYCSEMTDYIVDVYVEKKVRQDADHKQVTRHKVWLIDINPWIPECVDSLLFTWTELLQHEEREGSEG